MVMLHQALTILSFATAISAASPERHAKRLFGLSWDTPVTTSTSVVDASPVATSVAPSSVHTAPYDLITRVPTTPTTTSTPSMPTTAATTGLGTAIYKDLAAIPDGDRIAIWTLDSLSAQQCHDLCAASSACSFYNIYTAASSYFHGSTPYCALYGEQKSAADAVDTGTSAGLTYGESDGYAMADAAQVTVSIGTASPAAATTAVVDGALIS